MRLVKKLLRSIRHSECEVEIAEVNSIQDAIENFGEARVIQLLNTAIAQQMHLVYYHDLSMGIKPNTQKALESAKRLRK